MSVKPIIGLCVSGRTGSTLLQRLLNMSPDTVIFSEQKGMISFVHQVQSESMFSHAFKGHEHALRKCPQDHNPAFFPTRGRLQSACKAYFDTLYGYEGKRWGFVDLFYEHMRPSYNKLLGLYPEADVIFHYRDAESTYESSKKVGWAPLGKKAWMQNFEGAIAKVKVYQSMLPDSIETHYEDILDVDYVEQLYKRIGITFDRQKVIDCLACKKG